MGGSILAAADTSPVIPQYNDLTSPYRRDRTYLHPRVCVCVCVLGYGAREQIGFAADVAVPPPHQQGSFRTLSCICSNFHLVIELTNDPARGLESGDMVHRLHLRYANVNGVNQGNRKEKPRYPVGITEYFLVAGVGFEPTTFRL